MNFGYLRRFFADYRFILNIVAPLNPNNLAECLLRFILRKMNENTLDETVVDFSEFIQYKMRYMQEIKTQYPIFLKLPSKIELFLATLFHQWLVNPPPPALFTFEGTHIFDVSIENLVLLNGNYQDITEVNANRSKFDEFLFQQGAPELERLFNSPCSHVQKASTAPSSETVFWTNKVIKDKTNVVNDGHYLRLRTNRIYTRVLHERRIRPVTMSDENQENRAPSMYPR